MAFTINKEYAAKYDSWRQKEELMKLKARYGENPSSDESSSESDDDAAEEVTPEVEKEFFRTLSCLKFRDPKIYRKDVKFFENTEDDAKSDKKSKKTKEKPLYMKDYERQIIVNNDGKFVDEDDCEDVPCKANKRKHNVQKQQILQEFQEAAQNLDDSDDDLLQKRTKLQPNDNELSYTELLKGQAGPSKKPVKAKMPEELKPLQQYWTNPKLDEEESFLRDYILEKKYIGPRDKEKNLTYEEIVNTNDDLSEDEETLMAQLDFEHKFNFRFEEPDPEFIKRYPRTLDFAMRKKSENRIKKRAETRTRKEKEKQKKKADLNRLKALKKKEILDRLEKIKKITGDSIPGGFVENDVDGEFDPDEHDRRMQEIFNEDYYDIDEQDKPEIPIEDEDLETEDWDNWNIEKKAYEDPAEPEDRDDSKNYEDDCEPGPSKINLQKELIEKSRGKKKRRLTKFYEMINSKRPAFEPDKKTIEEYTDEFYRLDYEDIIDDIPCRFKYRQVAANDFGLTVDEILSAEDRELNQWCPVRTTCQYKTEYEEKIDIREYKKKGRRWKKKASVFKSIYAPNEVKDADADKQSLNKDPPPQKIQERLWKGNNDEFIELPDERLEAYGIDPKEYNKQKKRDRNGYRSGKFKHNTPNTRSPYASCRPGNR